MSYFEPEENSLFDDPNQYLEHDEPEGNELETIPDEDEAPELEGIETIEITEFRSIDDIYNERLEKTEKEKRGRW